MNFSSASNQEIITYLDHELEQICIKKRKIVLNLPVILTPLQVDIEFERKDHSLGLNGLHKPKSSFLPYTRANIWANRVKQQNLGKVRIMKPGILGLTSVHPNVDDAFQDLSIRNRFGKGEQLTLTIYEICDLLREIEEISKSFIFV